MSTTRHVPPTAVLALAFAAPAFAQAPPAPPDTLTMAKVPCGRSA